MIDLNKITIGTMIVIIVFADKVITYLYKKFNTAYKIKRETEDFIQLVSNQQKIIDQSNTKIDLLIEGIKEMLKSELKILHKEYMDRGNISSEELDNFNHLYEVYHLLGGNGTGTKYYDEVCQLQLLD